ncbi:hypothetical protein QOZ80_2AG0107750 [Eleusine coracana subsp. coracana]|nr:hypothetical protein QOZ80_2AG0107750 [Eleusine coracana subsp. coracana]
MGLSCSRDGEEHDLFRAAQVGDLETLDALLAADPSLARRASIYERLSALHIAAGNGHVQVVSMLLERGAHPDLLNRKKQTPLMVAVMHGRIECVLKLLEAGANMLMFDCVHGRTCLHHAAYYGHADCLRAVLSAAAQNSSPVTSSWGFARFVNLRDERGATALHLAARQGRAECVHVLLDKGAMVSSSSWSWRGSTALHLAARAGNLACIRELLAWGADRHQRDSAGRIAYAVAIKRRHAACAALLNPASAEPMVWPSPLKLISELNPEAKALLQAALMEANNHHDDSQLNYSSDYVDSESAEVCGICLEQACNMIQVQDCGHQMCAPCTLALCCHSKPNPVTLTVLHPPACPFCRGAITNLLVPTLPNNDNDMPRRRSSSRRFRQPSEGSSSSFKKSEGSSSSSFRGLSSAIFKSARFADKPPVDKPHHHIM